MGTLDKNTKFKSIYRVSDAQPNWAQTDPSQPDYIKNRDMAQEVRPIKVNGESFLNSDPDSGAVDLVAGENITLTTSGNTIIISSESSGGTGGSSKQLELVGGAGITITDVGSNKKILKVAEQGISEAHIADGAVTEEKIEDAAITGEKIGSESVDSKHLKNNAILNRHLNASAVQSRNIGTDAIQSYHISNGAIQDEHIASVSFDKIVQNKEKIIILNGGNANG